MSTIPGHLSTSGSRDTMSTCHMQVTSLFFRLHMDMNPSTCFTCISYQTPTRLPTLHQTRYMSATTFHSSCRSSMLLCPVMAMSLQPVATTMECRIGQRIVFMKTAMFYFTRMHAAPLWKYRMIQERTIPVSDTRLHLTSTELALQSVHTTITPTVSGVPMFSTSERIPFHGLVHLYTEHQSHQTNVLVMDSVLHLMRLVT